jgi:Zn-dependent protease/predicted transcriptional regulator
VVWLSAGLTAALFFTTLLVHELSHAWMARACGLPVGAITLFALGGVSHIKRESEDARSEFLIGVVGPLTSVLIGSACLGLAWAGGWQPGQEAAQPGQAVLVWLGYINVVLAAFNMIPGYPLDGGRVLRAIVWAVSGDAHMATRVAARVGQGFALLFIVYGMLRFFGGAGFGGLWLAFIGWFLLSVASLSFGRLEAMDVLRTVRAEEVMTRDCPVVEPRTSVSELVFAHLLRTGRRCFLVGDEDRVSGLVTLPDLKAVPREEWHHTSVQAVMRPIGRVRSVSLETPASELFEAMTTQDIHQVPVVEDGKLYGIVSRGDLLRVLQARADLKA